MQTQEAFLESLKDKISYIKSETESRFYYLESEDLNYKPSPEKWNIIEVFEHLNLTNEHYLKELNNVIKEAPSFSESSSKRFRLSWMGKQMVKSMEPRSGKIPYRMKTFKKTNPLTFEKQGRKLVDHVVFQDFMSGLEQFMVILDAAKDKRLQKLKIRSLIPVLKLKTGDALAFIIAHIERHLEQAGKLTVK